MSTEQPAMESGSDPAVEPDKASEVTAAAEAVRRAKEEFEKACTVYQNLRKEAVDRVRKLREGPVGDAVEESLEMVRKHPALGVGLGIMVGFFLGRLFRR